ncbi:MAG: zinc ribbon domain-containing protein [Leptolyngbyaceae cyanobacterium SM1_1_3]|nr:zinc ribbon domain-containing protein [Leptolyngbyaceae cyanobacterium SM1_1_3]NJN02187.1 zinc ribbon domain-containing protein [Leptolyngbyaceae cyanobacterium RM1_1_2]
MPVCPRCQQSIQATAIQCPRCQLTLKAHGHPGIELYRADEGAFLCPDCIYHADNSCNFPQRPLARSCTLYQPESAIAVEPTHKNTFSLNRIWLRRNRVWLVLAGLLLISLLIAI